MSFSQKIIRWYLENKRDLPWRNSNEPYNIWLSEIILQQTRVEQGLPYYYRFIEKYPSLKSLAEAEEDEVLKLWQGLGYYSRARNMLYTAREVLKNYGGKFPDNYKDILNLKGVGDYTAAAISSFAFDLPYACVDGNVYRALSRIFGIYTPIDSTAGKKEFSSIANELIDQSNPGIFNQGMMEFGARQCKPTNPDCSICPFSIECFALKNNATKNLPVKSKNTTVKERYLNYLVLNYNNGLFLKKRIEKDIWQNMYDFPLIETQTQTEEKTILSTENLNKYLKNKKWTFRAVSETYTHQLSHRKLLVRFYEIDIESNGANSLKENYIFAEPEDLKSYSTPKLIENYLNDRAKNHRSD
jgi:A/G-specific adenine glycosylase